MSLASAIGTLKEVLEHRERGISLLGDDFDDSIA